MTSIEGNRGEPRPRPPFPAVKGLFGKPTILNNVETYANVPQIILKGAEWFASMGTEKSKGTKVFALGGKINNTGLVEIPMGTTLREIVEEIGGGIPNGKKFKAAQTGGPSGGCIPASLIDTPIDYDNLIAIGSMMGSGGLIVMDEDTCMVDIAKFFLEFTVDESCGKCTPCRVGTKRLLEILDKITDGKATMEDLDKLEELCYYIKANSLCGLGQTAPNPVLSTLRYFRDEYVAHIVDKRCPAGVCKALLQLRDRPRQVQGLHRCAPATARPAPSPARSSSRMSSISAKCIKCGACMEKCKFGAIIKKLREGGHDMETVNIKINGMPYERRPRAPPSWKRPGSAGIEIPTLCYLKEINEIGACRICVVEVKGARSLVTACVYPVNEGMEIITNTDKVMASRKTNLELILSTHDKNCLSCVRSGDCELQKLCRDYGVDEHRFIGEPRALRHRRLRRRI